MAITPDRTAEIRDQHIADLRAALERAAPLLAFAAGREAVGGDPKQAELLMQGAGEAHLQPRHDAAQGLGVAGVVAHGRILRICARPSPIGPSGRRVTPPPPGPRR